MTTTNEQKLATDLRSTMIHLKIASHSLEDLRSNRLSNATRTLGKFAKELLPVMNKAIHKMEWFIGVAHKVVDESTRKQLLKDLSPDSANYCNIACLNEWVIETPGNVDNEVDLIVNASRRREIMHNAWRIALGGTMSEHDELRFNAWYNANFHPSKQKS